MRTAFNKSAIPIIYPVIGKTYFQPDIYGSILSVSDGQGQSLGYSEWDVRGNVKFHGQGRTPLPEGGGNPCFTSYIPDPVIGKHFAQARFYDPSYGRMLSPDPVKRGLNGYPYCGNGPVNYVDPAGGGGKYPCRGDDRRGKRLWLPIPDAPE